MENIFGKIGTTQTLSQKIERKIEDAIRTKKLLVGEKIPTERELCEMFAVSRTALREALRRLSARGLITIRKGSGMYVSEIKIEDAIDSLHLYYDLNFDNNLIDQVIEVRKHFEPQIAMLAARNRTDEQIEVLKANISEFKKCNPDNTQLEVDIDNRFHLNMAKASKNPVIIISMEPIYSLLPRMRNYFYGNIDGEKEITTNYHQNILDAVIAQDEEKAYTQMKEHVLRSEEIYLEHFKK